MGDTASVVGRLRQANANEVGRRASSGSRPWRALAVLMVAATVAAATVGLGVRVRGGIAAVEVAAFVLALAWTAVGAVALRRSKEDTRTGSYHLLVTASALVATSALAAGRIVQSEAPHPHALSRDCASVATVLVAAMTLHVLLSLPDGRLAGRARTALCMTGYAAAVAFGITLLARGEQVSPLECGVCWSIVVACALGPLRSRYAKAEGPGRERLQWFALGAVASGGVAMVAAVLHLLVGWPQSLAPVALSSVVLVPAALIASATTLSGPHTGRILVRSVAVFGLAAMVSLVYIVVVLGLGHRPATTSERAILGLSICATALAAASFMPTWNRVNDAATRYVFGAREAPDEVVRTFGSRLTRAIPMDELLLQLAESLRKTMGLASAEIFTGMGEVLERAASVPDMGPGSVVISPRERPVVTRAGVSGNAWATVWLPSLGADGGSEQLRVAPVSHAGELLGLIVVKRASHHDAFSDEDDRVLTDLARQVGLALHNSQLDTALQTSLAELRRQAQELRESRARIVASGDAERRRVERNLHDGAQQHLVALAVNLRLARDIVEEDPATGAEMLDGLVAEVQETIQELRELAHGIYPPLLVDRGLVEALRAAANRSPLSVEVIADGARRYAAETEAAVYFCCVEALQNAAKHAPDAQVELRLWEESGGLLFAVVDDGPGFDVATAQKGHGFMNMSDRLGAIGGTVRWESEIGRGSAVRGSVPLI